MAEVLALPFHKDGLYYRSSSSPKCRSPQPSYTPPYDQSVPRSQLESQLDLYGSFQPPSRKLSPPPSSVSSPDLSSLVYSTQTSASSSVSSSVCLDHDQDDFFPVYDFDGRSSPEPEPFRIGDEQQPPADPPCRTSTPELAEPEFSASRPRPADDTCVRQEPSRHVDYLSHEWREEDIWASWRYIVNKRNAHSNAARLENASWRTWAKKKDRLRTVSADKLNWLVPARPRLAHQINIY